MTAPAIAVDEPQGGPVVLVLRGEIDLSLLDELEARVAEAEQRAAGRLVLDLSAASFIDSSVMGTLVRLRNRVEQDSGSMATVAPPPSVREMFEITGLGAVFDFQPNLADAIAAVDRG